MHRKFQFLLHVSQDVPSPIRACFFFSVEKGDGKSGKPLHYKGITFHKLILLYFSRWKGMEEVGNQSTGPNSMMKISRSKALAFHQVRNFAW